MVQKIPFSAWLGMLAELVTIPNFLDGAKVAIYTNAVTPSDLSALPEFTLATFAGSTPVTVAWGAVHSDPVDGPVVTAASIPFIASADPTAPETIYGAILTNSAGTALLAACRFDTPLTISASGQGVVVVPQYGPGGKWLML